MVPDEASLLRQQAYHQAGHEVVTMLMMGSLSNGLRRRDGGVVSTPQAGWKGAKQLYDFNAKMVMGLMGGYTAENLFCPAHFTGEQTRIDRSNEKILQAQIIADLKEKSRLFSYVDESDPTLPFQDMVDNRVDYLPSYRRAERQ